MFSHIKELFTRPSGYTIARSVRLRSSASGYFNRTPASSTSSSKYTLSMWVKMGALQDEMLFAAGASTANQTYIRVYGGANQAILWETDTSSTSNWYVQTSALFRDPSAWYHFVFAYDSSLSGVTNQAKIYVNGVQASVSTGGTGTNSYVNTTVAHYIGRHAASSLYFDGYLTEINFIDGQALTPSSFGETDSITGVWKAKKYSGTYGTNGFYLNFSDNSNNTATTIGKDYSGNGNNWTPNNISVTSGATYDSMVDSPTVGATSSNYAVWNVLKSPSTYGTITNGNLTTNANTTYELNAISSISSTTGKFYAEFTVQQANTARPNIGIQAINQYQTYTGANLVSSATTVVWSQDGRVFANASLVGTFATYTTGDIICVAVDCDNGAIYYNKNNGAWINSGSPTSGASRTGSLYNWTGGTVDYGFYIDDSFNGNITNANFGQRPFSYTPPTGFVALNTYNLPASTIKNGAAYMAATLYTGTGASLTVANTVGSASFQPDFVWVKGRSGATDHALYDSVRGVQKQIESNQTGAETTETTGLTAFGSTGFTVGALAQMNTSSATYVGWQWKAGTTSSSNTNGSITSTVSVGATQGFSVVTYTGNGTLNATIGHGLGVAPSMVIIKNRVGANNWDIYHISNGAQKYMDFTTAGVGSLSTIFPTTPTSSVVYLGTTGGQNTNATNYVAYCFAAVAGYSAFGSYTGNGSADGPFIYTGFRPRFVLIKISSGSTGSWYLLDSSRDTYNVASKTLFPDLSNAEGTGANFVDFLSNGFKLRNAGGSTNGSGFTFIYAAFAENPTKYALAR